LGYSEKINLKKRGGIKKMGDICSRCQGTGKVFENGLFGPEVWTCPICLGKGSPREDGKCSKCQGTGKVFENGLFGLEVHTCPICLGKGY
jgi:DnaJ-class molecular chaperone